MSAKWRRSQAWDKQNLTGALAPFRVVLHELSSIRLAVCLLLLVSLYAVLASVPIGLLALAPTWAIYAATFLLSVLLLAAAPVLLIRKGLLHNAGMGVRFAVPVLVFIPLAVLASWVWQQYAWPALRYDELNGTGLRLIPGFVAEYESTTLRRLPGLEMSELEFYSWWPLRIILLLFCVNMIIATLRRIEFCFKNLGVLTVHTGIITIALGSIFYQAFKQEGDTILLAGQTSDVPGPAARGFYDNQELALFVAQRDGVFGAEWEQRRLTRIPRYNEYNLLAAAGDPEDSLWRTLGLPDPIEGTTSRPLSRPVAAGRNQFVDPDLSFRVVGYAPYADPREDWVRQNARADGSDNPLRIVELEPDMPPELLAQMSRAIGREIRSGEPLFRFTMLPGLPAQRVRENQMLGLEYQIEPNPERFAQLATPLPENTAHALLVTVPNPDGEPFQQLLSVTQGGEYTLGNTGFGLHVEQLSDQPPFPIITPGYQDASSSVAVVHVSPPEGSGLADFDRWLYHRFPELDQDLAKQAPPDGRPARTPADLSTIEITYLDASRLQVFFAERADGSVHTIVREPGGAVRLVMANTDDPKGERVEDIITGLDLVVAHRWENARLVSRPVPTPEADRDNQFIGTHDRAMIAIEVTSTAAAFEPQTVWVEFSKYFYEFNQAADAPIETAVLPDGRSVRLGFGRLWRPFTSPTRPNPTFQTRMVDFEMIAYDHRGAPRDYQSVIRVEPTPSGEAFKPYEHTVKLNAPLRAPFHWDHDASGVVNTLRRLARGFNPGQFKLSQAGWDQQGWTESQQLADQGLTDRPRAKFTILAVGNNPGIHVVALGSIMMALGIPWAFYLKPWLVRRERDRLKALHAKPAASTQDPPSPPAPPAPPATNTTPTPQQEASV